MRLHPALLVALLSLLVVGSAVGSGTPSQTAPANVDTAVTSQTDVNEPVANGTTIRIIPQPDGDARWNVSMEFALRNENETAAFKELGERFKNGDTSVGFSADTFRHIAGKVESKTGRQMKIRQVEPSYEVYNQTGTLTLRFVWTNFTKIKNDRIILRDAFLLQGGESTWLGSLSTDQQLVIEDPKGYRIQNSPNFGHSNGTINVKGPTSLYPGKIDVTYVKEDGDFGNRFSMTQIALLLFVFGIGGAGLYILIQRREDETEDDPAPDERPTPPPTSEPEPEPDDELNVELLSDEERVEHLLGQNGGRMKQAKIVTETNWSNAKVSQLLSSMDDEGRIDKLRIGRENLITLPDENIADFDDE